MEEPEPALEQLRVTGWRLGRLLELGVPVEEAELLAERRDVDVHELESLVRRGCPVEVAVRIVR